MPRLERLITLARLRQGGKHMTVREMSQACGVSQRTLYRYLNTLSELDPVGVLAADAGGHHSKLDSSRLSADDTNLLRYALAHNPLVEYRHFACRFRRLGRQLKLGQGRSVGGAVYQFKSDRSGAVNRDVDDLLSRFGKACIGGRPVKMQLRGQRREVQIVWPRKILVKGDRVSLLMALSEHGRPKEFGLDQLQKLGSFPGISESGARRTNRKKG